jgi:hypothetical protein
MRPEAMKKRGSLMDRVFHVVCLVASVSLALGCFKMLLERGEKKKKEMSEIFLGGFSDAYREIREGRVGETDLAAVGRKLYIRCNSYEGKYVPPRISVRTDKKDAVLWELKNIYMHKLRNPYLFSFNQLLAKFDMQAREMLGPRIAVSGNPYICSGVQSYFSGRAPPASYKMVLDFFVKMLLESNAAESLGLEKDGPRILLSDYDLAAVLLGTISNNIVGKRIDPQEMCRVLGVDYSRIEGHPLFVRWREIDVEGGV